MIALSAFVGIEETPDQLLILERPDVDVLVLTAHSQELVIRAQCQAAYVCFMLQSHQALCFVACYVVKTNSLVSAQGYDEADSCLVQVGGVGVDVAPLEVSNRTILLVEA